MRLGIDRYIDRVRAQPDQRHHGAVGIRRSEIADGSAEVDPLAEILGIFRALGGKRGAHALEHLRPALGGVRAQNGCVEGHARPHVDGGELFQQRRVGLGGRVRLHQRVSRVEELRRRHGEHLVHGNKVVFLGICARRRGIVTARQIRRERKEPHLILNGVYVGQILVSGEHDAGNRPHRFGGHIHAGHVLGQLARPARERDGICARLIQHGGGVRPCVQKLHVAETIRFRQDVHHGFRADIKPRLRIEGIHIRRDDGAEGGVRQLLGMVDLVDGRAPRHASVRIG